MIHDKNLGYKIIALLMDEGFRPSVEMVRYLTEVLDGSWTSERHKQHEPEEQRAFDDDDFRTMEREEPGSEDENNGESGSSNHWDQGLLSAFNHTIAEHANWIIIPFTTKGVTGRLLLHTDAERQTADECSINVDMDSERILCIVKRMKDGTRLVRFACETSVLRKKIGSNLSILREKLRNSAVKIDDTIYDCSEFDHFGDKMNEGIVGIDRQV